MCLSTNSTFIRDKIFFKKHTFYIDPRIKSLTQPSHSFTESAKQKSDFIISAPFSFFKKNNNKLWGKSGRWEKSELFIIAEGCNSGHVWQTGSGSPPERRAKGQHTVPSPKTYIILKAKYTVYLPFTVWIWLVSNQN